MTRMTRAVAASAAANAAAYADLVAEIRHLLGTDSPEHIARRLGYTPSVLARRLARRGDHELARMFERKPSYGKD